MTLSIWRATAQVQPAAYPPLVGALEVDAAIVGGGITGITCAALLAAEGRRVVLLEARTIASGSTGNSTGNLYEVLSSGLAAVAKKWSTNVARDVAASRRQAVDRIEGFAGRFQEETCFRRCALYQYSPDDWSKIEQEYEALRTGGIAARVMTGRRSPGLQFKAVRWSSITKLNFILSITCGAYAHWPPGWERVSMNIQKWWRSTPSIASCIRDRDL